jgi:hypothetical protein
MKLHTPASISESLCTLLRQAHDGLARQAWHEEEPVIDLGPIRELLEALPLGSADFGLAVNRLVNAQHYLHAGERGAARYELRLLLRSLDK